MPGHVWYHALDKLGINDHTLTKSAVTMASSVCDPGSHIALMMKLPASNCGCSTRWSDTVPELVNVNTWQSWRGWKEENILQQLSHMDTKQICYTLYCATNGDVPSIVENTLHKNAR